MSLLFNLLPFSAPGRALNSIENRLILHPVVKIRLRLAILLKCQQEVVQRVNERMFVADDVARWPPRADIRMDALGNENRLITLVSLTFGTIIKFELIHPFQVEGNAAFAAINLKGVIVAPSAAESEDSITPTLPFLKRTRKLASSS